MSTPSGKPLHTSPDDDSSEDGSSSFDWEFVHDDHGAHPATPLPTRETIRRPVARSRVERRANDSGVKNRDGERGGAGARHNVVEGENGFGRSRANFVRDQLDEAVDAWWTSAALPSLMLLRDGLRLLEAGEQVSESQRTLLLRAALAYDRGVQTALKHQLDDERVALVLAEAAVEWESPVSAERIAAMLDAHAHVRRLLMSELERSRVLLTGEARRRANETLAHLRSGEQGAQSPDLARSSPRSPIGHRGRLRPMILLLLVATFIAFAIWQRPRSPDGMISMPAAEYALLTLDGDGAAVGVALDAFYIDKYEVTNRAYRDCIEAGRCKWPLQSSSATRRDYFVNPSFDRYPVVHVTQLMALDYCAWKGMRLPSAQEWQAAASVSPVTGQFFPFPWGATFDRQRANSASGGFGDTLAVGSFRPGGDSPAGISDMAGNVAEWTSTRVEASLGVAQAIVKGGAFDNPDAGLLVSAQEIVDINSGSSRIGFRCALNKK